eukprot:gene11589-7984_t
MTDSNTAVLFVIHDAVDPPGNFGEYLKRQKINFIVFHVWRREHAALLPRSTAAVVNAVADPKEPYLWEPVEAGTAGSTPLRLCGVVSLGGRISANDDLPYYPALFDLIRDCVKCRVPFMGHCLGAQQLAVALGGKVTVAPRFEFDFLPVTPVNPSNAPNIKPWFLEEPTSTFFLSHAETFSIPEGCHLVATGEFCYNQAFQVGDQYILGTQFHPEVTMEMVNNITTTSKRCPTEAQVSQMTAEERETKYPSCVKTQEALVGCSGERVEFTRKYVDHLYDVEVVRLRKEPTLLRLWSSLYRRFPIYFNGVLLLFLRNTSFLLLLWWAEDHIIMMAGVLFKPAISLYIYSLLHFLSTLCVGDTHVLLVHDPQVVVYVLWDVPNTIVGLGSVFFVMIGQQRIHRIYYYYCLFLRPRVNGSDTGENLGWMHITFP